MIRRPLIDRFVRVILPPSALRWGRLTTEPFAWHVDLMRRSLEHVQRQLTRAFGPTVDDYVHQLGQLVEAYPLAAPVKQAAALRAFEEARRYHDEQMARSTLMDFVRLGRSTPGAYRLSRPSFPAPWLDRELGLEEDDG